MHFDARKVRVPQRAMCETVQIKIGGKLPVCPHQKIPIECGGDAGDRGAAALAPAGGDRAGGRDDRAGGRGPG